MKFADLFKKLPRRSTSERIGTVITIAASALVAMSVIGYAISYIPTSARETAYLKNEKAFISCLKEEASKLPRSKLPFVDWGNNEHLVVGNYDIGEYHKEQTNVFASLDKPYFEIFSKSYDWRHSRLYKEMDRAINRACIQDRDRNKFWMVAAYKCLVDRKDQLVVIENIYYYKLKLIREPSVSLIILSFALMAVGLLTSVFNKYTVQPVIRLTKWIIHGDKNAK